MGAVPMAPTSRDLIAEIHALRTERHAAILAHNYQRAEIQDLADVVADSLKLARRATELDAPVVVLCGVPFMAETAAIANPDKTVLIPDPTAGCSLAATIQAADVRAWRATHPPGGVGGSVNTPPRAAHPPRRGCGGLRQRLGRGESRVRLLLHVGQRRRGDQVAPSRRAAVI